jgi:hypothetical protein
MKTILHTQTRAAKLLLLATLLFVAALPSHAYIKYLQGVYYDRIGTTNMFYVTYKDSTYNSYNGTINIPDVWSTNHNYKVVAIGERAFKDCSNLTQVNIGFNVDTIHEYAFQNCTVLPAITIPENVDIIEDYAFEGCSNLNNITLPTSVNLGKYLFKGCSGITSLSFLAGRKAIEIGMFRDCSGLTNIQLPQSIDSICDFAFMGCQGLSKLTITKYMKNIGKFAFKNCNNLDTVVFDAAVSGITINTLAFSGCSALTTIVSNAIVPPVLNKGLGLSEQQLEDVKLIVPNTALEAYKNADGWKEFVNIEARPYDFENNGVFFNVTSENEVCITYKDTSYNSYYGTYSDEVVDFYGSAWDGFQYWWYMVIPGNVTYGGKKYYVTSIGENAFRNCTHINAIHLEGHNIKHIADNAFRGCSKLKEVTFPNTLKRIGAHAFEGCSSLYVAFLEEGVTSIDSCAFKGCTKLLCVVLPSTTNFVGARAFEGCPLNGHDLTANVGIYCYAFDPPTIENSNAFSQGSYSSSVVKVLYSRANTYRQDEMWGRFSRISPNVYDFSKNGVYYRINSESEVSIAPSNEVIYGGNNCDAVLPEQVEYNGNTYTVTAVDYKAFYFSDHLNITIPNTVKRIGELAFAKVLDVRKLELGNSVESIGYGAFNECYLGEITIPQSVKYIGDSAFFSTPQLRKIIVEDGNPVFDSRDNCNAIIKTATNTLIAASKNTVIPSTVTAIGGGAFCGKTMDHITIPSSVKTIGKYAFMAFNSNNVEFELPSSIEYIDTMSFAGTNLKKIDIPNSVKAIGYSAFSMNMELKEINIPNSVETIGLGAFTHCYSLDKLIIPNSVTTIEPMAFVWCKSLKELHLGSGLKTIGDWAFNCQGVPDDNGNLVNHAIGEIYCTATIPPTMLCDDCFETSYSSATLYVPESSLEKYKTAYGWKRFFQILPIEESAINEVPVDSTTGKHQRYNLMGQPVGDDYHGIVIENGKKILVE